MCDASDLQWTVCKEQVVARCTACGFSVSQNKSAQDFPDQLNAAVNEHIGVRMPVVPPVLFAEDLPQ